MRWRWINLALKADALLTELETGADDRLPQTADDAQGGRLMVEGRTTWALLEDSHLTPVFEVGDRWDGGKEEGRKIFRPCVPPSNPAVSEQAMS